MKRTLLLLLIVVTAHKPHAQTRRINTDNPMRSELDSLVDRSARRYMQDSLAVGLSLGMLVNGKSFFYNYGETRSGNRHLPCSTTIYEIGSITKTFTGILLAQAVLDKKFSLEDDIRKYLPGDWPNLAYEGTPVRVKDLANHTSGITRIFRNLWDRKEYDSANPLHDYTRDMLYEGLRDMKLEAPPGNKSSYSNMAVALLGTMLENAYGQTWFALASKHILKPLGMKSTRTDLSGIPAKNIATPHNDRREPVPLWDMSYLPAMGSLRSTTADMLLYIRANNQALSPAMALSHQPTFVSKEETLGLNWYLHTLPGGQPILEHSGGTGGSRSSMDCFPGLNSGLIILTNSLANRKILEKELIGIIMENAHL